MFVNSSYGYSSSLNLIQAADIEKVYLIGTNQNPEVREREKDTIYACELIKTWLVHHYPHIAVEVIPLGVDGTNPSNFEQMFRWWQKVWKKEIIVQPEQPIRVGLKGGVGKRLRHREFLG